MSEEHALIAGRGKKKNKRKRKHPKHNTNKLIIEKKTDEIEIQDAQIEHPDSEDETAPKKRKKKKKPIVVETDSSGKRIGKSIRQMKKEKFAEREAEAQGLAKQALKQQCINYLSQWKHDKANWKFMKAKQVWLYKNKFSRDLIPKESWPLFLEYFSSANGNIKKMLTDDANKIIEQMERWLEKEKGEGSENAEDKNDESEEKVDNSEAEIDKPSTVAYKRARDIIQHIQV